MMNNLKIILAVLIFLAAQTAQGQWVVPNGLPVQLPVIMPTPGTNLSHPPVAAPIRFEAWEKAKPFLMRMMLHAISQEKVSRPLEHEFRGARLIGKSA